jgi:hypothetical protein
LLNLPGNVAGYSSNIHEQRSFFGLPAPGQVTERHNGREIYRRAACGKMPLASNWAADDYRVFAIVCGCSSSFDSI